MATIFQGLGGAGAAAAAALTSSFNSKKLLLPSSRRSPAERKASSLLVVRSDGSVNLNLGSSNGRARRVDQLITNAVAVNLSSPLVLCLFCFLSKFGLFFIYSCFLFCFRRRLILLQLPLHRNLGMNYYFLRPSEKVWKRKWTEILMFVSWVKTWVIREVHTRCPKA